MFRKSFIGMTIESESFVGSEGLLNDLSDPQQHFLKAKQFEKQLRFIVVFPFGKAKMNPHPHIAQHQGNAHEQQSQPWIASACFDFRFVHLAVARFDPKTFAIEFPFLPLRFTLSRCLPRY